MLSALDTGFEDGFLSFLDRDIGKELLRFTTAGSVDDGKSTLIGRLLHDSKAVYEDQLASVKKSKINRSGGPIDFSLLTDGLRAEREQGIDRKSTRLNSSHGYISYAVFCLTNT